MPNPIVIDEKVNVPATALTVTAVRSSGPGGQNVNKVSSKIELRVDLTAVIGLNGDARERLFRMCSTRLDAEGRLLLTSQKTRDRERNLEDAFEKVRKLIRDAMVEPTFRKATKPSRAVKRRRVEDKRRTGAKKQERNRPLD